MHLLGDSPGVEGVEGGLKLALTLLLVSAWFGVKVGVVLACLKNFPEPSRWKLPDRFLLGWLVLIGAVFAAFAVIVLTLGVGPDFASAYGSNPFLAI